MKVTETTPPANRTFSIELDEEDLRNLVTFLGRLNKTHMQDIMGDSPDYMSLNTEHTYKLINEIWRLGCDLL